MEIIFRNTIWKPDDKYRKHRIPGMIVTSKGMILAYTEARDGTSDWARMDIQLYRSHDGGRSFDNPITLARGTSSHPTVNNPVMIEDCRGTIHFLHAEDYGIAGGRILHYTSQDEGYTWSSPQDVTYATRPKERNAFALGPGHGICASDGTLLIPVWMVLKSASQPENSHHPSIVSVLYSKDNGNTWSLGESLATTETIISPSESSIAQLPDGSFYLNLRNDSQHRAAAFSQTGYSGWQDYTIDETLVDPICFGSVVQLSGKLYFGNCNHPSKRLNVCLRTSSDGGRIWADCCSVDADRGGYVEVACDWNKQIIYMLYEEDGGECCHFVSLKP